VLLTTRSRSASQFARLADSYARPPLLPRSANHP